MNKVPTDVKIKPFGGFLLKSVNVDDISWDNSEFNPLIGGLFNSNVAIPVLSSIDKLNNFRSVAEDEKFREESAHRIDCLADKALIVVINPGI